METDGDPAPDDHQFGIQYQSYWCAGEQHIAHWSQGAPVFTKLGQEGMPSRLKSPYLLKLVVPQLPHAGFTAGQFITTVFSIGPVIAARCTLQSGEVLFANPTDVSRGFSVLRDLGFFVAVIPVSAMRPTKRRLSSWLICKGATSDQ